MPAAVLNDNAPGNDVGGWGPGNGSHDGGSEERNREVSVLQRSQRSSEKEGRPDQFFCPGGWQVHIGSRPPGHEFLADRTRSIISLVGQGL